MIDKSPFTLAVLTCFGVASLAVWSLAAKRAAAGREVLPYEPRWRVTWGPAAGLLVVWIVCFLAVAPTPPEPPTAPAPSPPPAQRLLLSAGNAAVAGLFLLAMGTMLATATGAGLRDFGLPTSRRQAGADLGLGLLLFLAVLAPVLGVLCLLNCLLGGEEYHPELQKLATDRTAATLMAAWLTVGLVGPVFEEVLFRLLLQGWLEKVEDALLSFRVTARPRCVRPPGQEEGDARDDIFGATADDADDAPGGGPVDRRSLVAPGGLGHGWLPVLATAALFGAVHTNQGPAQAPLFLFGLVLGYAYQRTHRIAPCIVAHVAFNTFNLLLAFSAGGE